MPMGRIHKHSMSKKKLNKLIDKRLVVKAEKKVRTDLSPIFIDGSTDITLGTAYEETRFRDSLTDIIEGTGENERIGNEISLVGYKLKFQVYQSDTNCRMLIVQFPNSDGSDFLAALQSVNSKPVGFLPRKEDFPPGYKVLVDKALRFDSSEEVPRTYSLSLKVKGLIVKYDSGTNVTSGHIRCYVLTNGSSEGGVMGDIQGVSKIYWTD